MVEHEPAEPPQDEEDDDVDEDPDEDDDADDDGMTYEETHLDGRKWTEISVTDLSRTYAMDVHGPESTLGVLVRTVAWGTEREFGVALVYLPGVSMRELNRSKPEKKR